MRTKRDAPSHSTLGTPTKVKRPKADSPRKKTPSKTPVKRDLTTPGPSKHGGDVSPPSAQAPSPCTLTFVPLRPETLTEEEREREAERRPHLPLPDAHSRGDIHLARLKRVILRFSRANSEGAKKKTVGRPRKVKPGAELVPWKENEGPFNGTISRSDNSEHSQRESDRAQTLSRDTKALALAAVMGDLDSVCVVLLGDAKLTEADAKKRLDKVKEYERKKIEGKIDLNMNKGKKQRS